MSSSDRGVRPAVVIEEQALDRRAVLRRRPGEAGEAGNRAGAVGGESRQLLLRREGFMREPRVDPHLSHPTKAAGNRPGRPAAPAPARPPSRHSRRRGWWLASSPSKRARSVGRPCSPHRADRARPRARTAPPACRRIRSSPCAACIAPGRRRRWFTCRRARTPSCCAAMSAMNSAAPHLLRLLLRSKSARTASMLRSKDWCRWRCRWRSASSASAMR